MNRYFVWSRFPFSLSVLVILPMFVTGCATRANETNGASAPVENLTDTAIERYS
jgi:hypothetical protein